jgi:hypothetical protein
VCHSHNALLHSHAQNCISEITEIVNEVECLTVKWKNVSDNDVRFHVKCGSGRLKNLSRNFAICCDFVLSDSGKDNVTVTAVKQGFIHRPIVHSVTVNAPAPGE